MTSTTPSSTSPPSAPTRNACSGLRYSAPPDRNRRTEIFLTSYGWTGPADVVDGVVAVQRETHAKVEQLAARGHVRQRIALAEGAADRVACEIAWAEQNRGLFSPG